MNIQFLIDSIVQQTTILIAQLATSGGSRAPLAHVANQVFLDLARELEAEGVGRKVGADMFGMALRSYQRKIQRLSESATQRGRSLWVAVMDFLGTKESASRAEVMTRFRYDDEALVRGVLHDLCESGLVCRKGRGHHVEYRLASDEELGQLGQASGARGTDTLVWAMVYRLGPITQEGLINATKRPEGQLMASLQRLLDEDKIAAERWRDEVLYHCRELLIGFGEPVGWEAAVFDHFQAVVKTVIARLSRASTPSLRDIIGGSTYTFEVWDGHPMAEETYGLLRELRARIGELREQIEAYNKTQTIPDEYDSVVVYAGQCVTSHQQDDDSDKRNRSETKP